jgi:tetratricopeptide (TPR) repeat protein
MTRSTSLKLVVALLCLVACKSDEIRFSAPPKRSPTTRAQPAASAPAPAPHPDVERTPLPLPLLRLCRVMGTTPPELETEAVEGIAMVAVLECGTDADAFVASALQRYPKSAELQFQLSNLHSLRKQPEQEEQALRRALALDERHMPSWTNLALLLLHSDRLAEAQTAIAKAQAIARDEIVDQVAALVAAAAADPNFLRDTVHVHTYPAYADFTLTLAAALRLEDEASGLYLAKRALELHPSNVDAQQLVAAWETAR